MVWPDAHFGEHDERAIATALASHSIVKPDLDITLGDYVEGAAFSSHPLRTFADRAPGFLEGEIAPLNTFLDKLQGRNHRPLVYLEGNHEQRIERQALKLGAMGTDLHKLASPERLIRHRVNAHGKAHRERSNFTWVPYYGKGVHSHYMVTRELKHASALIAIHGWSHAMDAARQVLRAASDTSVIFGHTHRAQMENRRLIVGPRAGIELRAQSFGCLKGLCPTFTQHSPNAWTHGFGIIYVWDHTWEIFHVNIARDGSCVLPNGQLVVG